MMKHIIQKLKENTKGMKSLYVEGYRQALKDVEEAQEVVKNNVALGDVIVPEGMLCECTHQQACEYCRIDKEITDSEWEAIAKA